MTRQADHFDDIRERMKEIHRKPVLEEDHPVAGGPRKRDYPWLRRRLPGENPSS
jgi:hypothetical protein